VFPAFSFCILAKLSSNFVEPKTLLRTTGNTSIIKQHVDFVHSAECSRIDRLHVMCRRCLHIRMAKNKFSCSLCVTSTRIPTTHHIILAAPRWKRAF
jgi:hypothetical protein